MFRSLDTEYSTLDTVNTHWTFKLLNLQLEIIDSFLNILDKIQNRYVDPIAQSDSDDDTETFFDGDLELAEVQPSSTQISNDDEEEAITDEITEEAVSDHIAKIIEEDRKANKRSAQKKWNQKKRIEHSYLSGLPALVTQVVIGLGRDMTWGALTYRNVNLFSGKLGAFWGPTWTQTLLCLPITFATIKLTVDLSKKSLIFMDNRQDWVKKQLILALASWSSIPTWNMAQFAGNWCGEKLGLSPVGAGYFSGIFSGIAETTWQGMVVIPRLLNQPIDLTEVMFNTLGGAVWQWILQANLPNTSPLTANTTLSFEDMGVGAKIAFGVATTTLAMTLLAWEINRWRKRQDGYAPVAEPFDLEESSSESGEIIFKPYTGNKDILFPQAAERIEKNDPCFNPQLTI